MVKTEELKYPSFSFTNSACMILFLAHSKASCDKSVCSTQAGCVREAQNWDQMIKSMQLRNKQGSSVVDTGRFQEISGRNPDDGRD